MKYMTMDWWMGVASRENAYAYGPYFQAIKDRLPPGVLRLHDEISLHDAKLRVLYIDIANQTIDMELDGYARQPGKLPDSELAIILKYVGVSSVKSTADPENGLGGPAGYGDLGYDVIEMLERGLIEHRMLFSTGIEIQIQFRELEIQV